MSMNTNFSHQIESSKDDFFKEIEKLQKQFKAEDKKVVAQSVVNVKSPKKKDEKKL